MKKTLNFKNLLSEYSEYSDFCATLKSGKTPISVAGVVESAVGQFIFGSANEKNTIVITYSDQEAKQLVFDMELYTDNVRLFPTKEYVFFAKRDNLSADDFAKLDKTAWERGTSRAKPGYNHRSTDVTLVIVADTIEDTAKNMIKKSRHYKSYKWGFYGWSIYRLVAIESSCGKAYYNHRGKSLKKLVGNII